MDFKPDNSSVGIWHLCSAYHPIRVEIGRLDDISDLNSIQPLVSVRKEIHFSLSLGNGLLVFPCTRGRDLARFTDKVI